MQPGEELKTQPVGIPAGEQAVSSAQAPEDIENGSIETKRSLTAKVKTMIQDFVDYAKNTDL